MAIKKLYVTKRGFRELSEADNPLAGFVLEQVLRGGADGIPRDGWESWPEEGDLPRFFKDAVKEGLFSEDRSELASVLESEGPAKEGFSDYTVSVPAGPDISRYNLRSAVNLLNNPISY